MGFFDPLWWQKNMMIFIVIPSIVVINILL